MAQAAVSSREPASLRTGRERHQRAVKASRRREAIKRVRAYERWLKAGSRLSAIPSIPSNADYRIARGDQR